MGEVISKVIPIILLIIFGYYIQKFELTDKKTMSQIKKAIINISLPAVLFLTFKNMEFHLEHLFISTTVFFMLILFYLTGSLVNHIKFFHHKVLPFLSTGYSFGLLSIPLFGAVYGIENLGVISIFGIGHEIFAWFIYLTIIKGKLGGEKFDIRTIKNFLKSPIILSILFGLFFNLSGLSLFFKTNFILVGFERTLTYIASTATPIILIIIGYGLKLDPNYIKISTKLIIVRLIITLGIGYIIKIVVINYFMKIPNELFNVAYFTFLIAPPPFSLTIFVGEYSTEKNMIISNNTTVISTIVSIVIFLIVTIIM